MSEVNNKTKRNQFHNFNVAKKVGIIAIPCMKNWKQKMSRKANKKYFHENKRKYGNSIENWIKTIARKIFDYRYSNELFLLSILP